MQSYLRVGIVGGLCLGLVFALYTGVLFLPIMEQAEGFEHPDDHAHEIPAGQGVVPTLGTIGGIEVATLAGSLAWVVTLGVVTSIGYYFAEPALAAFDRHARGVVVGLAGFVAFRVAPWPVYPPVSPAAELALPPSVYVPWYWAIVATTALALLSLPFVYRYLDQRYETRVVGLGLLAVLAVPVVAVALAPTNPIQSIGAPAELHYQYMAVVVIGQLAVWTGLGVWIGHFAGVERPTGRQTTAG